MDFPSTEILKIADEVGSSKAGNATPTLTGAIDLTQAKQYCDTLIGGDSSNERFTFQTIDDDRTRKDPRLTVVLYGTLGQLAARLEDRNGRGAGVFITVNKTRAAAMRRAENIIRVRSLFVDLDGAPLDPVKAWEFHPHIIVESSPGKYHAYWRVDGVELKAFGTLQRKLATKFDGDHSVCDLPRILRLPGFWHQKKSSSEQACKPFLTRIIEAHPKAQPYSGDDLVAALKGVEERPSKSKASRVGPRVRLPREELSPRDYLNQVALDRIKDWAPFAFPGGEMHGTGAYRVRPSELGRECEEDLSIAPNGIRDFGQERGVPVGYTPVNLIQAFFHPGKDGELEPANFDETDKPSGTLSEDAACRWLAAQLDLDWDVLSAEDAQIMFAEPPYKVAEFRDLDAKSIRKVVDKLEILKLGWPETYQQVANHLEQGSVIGRGELDALVAERLKTAEVVRTGCLKFILMDEIDQLPEPHDFVEGVLCDGQCSVFFGDSNVGKSFFTLDLAMHVALGWPWRGKDVERGAVVYVAAEGGGGMKRRITAFRQHHGMERTADAALAIIPDTIDFRDPKAVAGLIQLVAEIAERLGTPVRWIIVDTLSRALAGGNENAPDDMGALVRGADQVRTATGAHLTFVHHSGKDDTRGARGHSLLRAAVDTEIKIESVNAAKRIVAAQATKQRDLEVGGPFVFALRKVELGADRRGKPITSCIVEATKREVELSETEHEALDILKQLIFDSSAPVVPVSEWRKALMSAENLLPGQNPDTRQKQCKRLRENLEKKGVVEVCDGRVGLRKS